MTKEQLLQPRYKAIASFWNCPFEVGEVITFVKEMEPPMPPIEELRSGSITKHLYSDFIKRHSGGSAMYSIESFKPYPHLFRKMEWWEERKAEDMPIYLKTLPATDSQDKHIPDHYVKVKKHFDAGNGEWRDNNMSIFCAYPNSRSSLGTDMHYIDFTPSTEEEYKDYITGQSNSKL